MTLDFDFRLGPEDLFAEPLPTFAAFDLPIEGDTIPAVSDDARRFPPMKSAGPAPRFDHLDARAERIWRRYADRGYYTRKAADNLNSSYYGTSLSTTAGRSANGARRTMPKSGAK